MQNHRVSSTSVLAPIVAAALIAVSGTAFGGAIYRGSFDPAVYNGEGAFDVDTSCIDNSAGFHLVTVGAGSCTGPVDILSVVLQLNSDPSSTITFAPDAGSNPLHNSVTELLWEGGNLDAVATTVLSSVSTTGSFTHPGGYKLQYGLVLNTDDTITGYTATVHVTCTPTLAPKLRILDQAADTDPGNCVSLSSGDATVEPFTRVPEPGTVVLLLAGLGAALGVKRRKSSR